MGRLFCKQVCTSSGQSTPCTSSFIVNKFDCVPGNAKIKLTISKDKGEYQESSQSQTGVQRVHWLLHSKQGWCGNYFALASSTALLQTRATQNKS